MRETFNGTIIKTTTQDGLELDAVLVKPKREKSKAIVIHFHGKEGDFLQNHFVFHMARSYPGHGYAFMTASHRGKNYLSDIVQRSASGYEYAQMGSAFDIFENSFYDIDAWVKEAKSMGFRNIILQAHSTPQKIIWYVYTKKDLSGIKALVLISPSDIAYGFERYVPNYKENLKLAEKMVKEGKGRELMPVNLWSNCPVSAMTFYNWGRLDSNIQIFNYFHPERGFKYFRKITLPIMATLGENDFAIGNPAEECIEMLKSATKSSNFKGIVIARAAHSYLGYEDKLSKQILNWIDKLEI